MTDEVAKVVCSVTRNQLKNVWHNLSSICQIFEKKNSIQKLRKALLVLPFLLKVVPLAKSLNPKTWIWDTHYPLLVSNKKWIDSNNFKSRLPFVFNDPKNIMPTG